jgi:hypothetical protein
MTTPQILIEDFEGRHNKDLEKSIYRLEKGKAYRDLSTICIIPTRGQIPAKVVESWWSMFMPMNQKFTRMFALAMEVGVAYSSMIEEILKNPELSKWKYILTMEEDNLPPVDGLLKLYEDMDVFDVVGGLYWTKGEMGQPMIYGDPKRKEMNFVPQKPIPDSLQECNGLGMGFNLFKMDIFRDPRVPRPFFVSLQEWSPGRPAKSYSQDLYFYENIRKLGYRVACDTRIKVGHYDSNMDIVW